MDRSSLKATLRQLEPSCLSEIHVQADVNINYRSLINTTLNRTHMIKQYASDYTSVLKLTELCALVDTISKDTVSQRADIQANSVLTCASKDHKVKFAPNIKRIIVLNSTNENVVQDANKLGRVIICVRWILKAYFLYI